MLKEKSSNSIEIAMNAAGTFVLNNAGFYCIFIITTPATLLRLLRQASAPGGFSFLGDYEVR
jgi:hypothetical protein